MDEYLWPARNVAEYAYCPRLFYLMEVEGLHLPSVDTEQGNAVHRRVNRPSAAVEDEAPADPNRPAVARSLTLTSAKLSLTATLDLAELADHRATPVEYRKGRPRYLAPDAAMLDDEREPGAEAPGRWEPWPTDRVQVGLQTILLEEAGYTVPEAVLYYAGIQRRVSVPVNAALREQAMQTLRDAQGCAKGSRPAPLLNDGRCAKCSLQPLCLPDEVNQQKARGAGGDGKGVEPRRLWPPRDDALHVVAHQDGVKIGVAGMALKVTDKNGEETRQIPLANVEGLTVVGAVQVSTQALHTLADRCIPVAFVSGGGRLVAMMDPLDSVSAVVRTAQVRCFDDPARCLELARALIAAKIANQRILLQRNGTGIPDAILEQMNQEMQEVKTGGSVDAVRGHEGQGAALYFGHLGSLVKGEAGVQFDVNGRQRRPPPDPLNAVLSWGYTMLSHECVTALRLARLEPTIGAFHVCRPGRPALALDLMEPFRPLVADSVALALFNRGELDVGHFMRSAAGCNLTDAGRRAFFSAWGRRMDTEVTHPVFGYRLSYRRMIQLHARMIAAWLLGEVPALAFLTTR